jgi:hypothetical protein
VRQVESINTECRCSNSTLHLHFSWFGLDFTFPVPPTENESNNDSNDSTKFVTVRPVNTAVVRLDDASFGLGWLAVVGIQVRDITVVVPAAPHFSSTPAPAALLCDTARHERSGVQLS